VPKRFASLRDAALDGVTAFAREVREGTYPAPDPAGPQD
jgi:ketopantoate hydroxymethyltransferase